MKLVEILAKELADWEYDLPVVTQEVCGNLWYADTGVYVTDSGNIWLSSDGHYGSTVTSAEDRMTAIVTREMWQAERDKLKQAEQVGESPRKCEGRGCDMPDSGEHSKECLLDAALDQEWAGPIQWRDRIREIDATIEAMTAERAELVRKLAGEGFSLIAIAVDPVEDMSDWRNWKVGDNIVCVSIEGKHCSEIHIGGIYTYTGNGGFNDGAGDEQKYALRHGGCFKWHSRPSS